MSSVVRLIGTTILNGLILGAIAHSVVAQTPTDLETKYGPPLNTYVIRTGLLLTVKYTAGKQVCAMSIVEAGTGGANISTRTPLTYELVRQLIDELVPEAERGQKVRAYGAASVTGMTAQYLFNYEAVSIELIQNLMPSKGWSDNQLEIKWNNRVCR